MRVLVAALACFSCVVARRAAAEEAPAPSAPHSVSAVQHGPTDARVPQGFTEDHLALLAHIGIGAPAGALGGDVDVMPVPEVALRLGAGLSFNGPQFSFMPRARIPIGKREHFTLGTGASVGRYDNYGAAGGLGCLLLCVGLGEGPARQTFARALWWNLEIGFDAYAPRGPGFFRASLGYGFILNNSDYRCAPEPTYGYPPGGGCDRTNGQGLLYMTAEFGFVL